MRDADVRRAILSRLASMHAGDDNTRIVEEMGVWSGSVRVDVAVINGEMSGYELKSDRDTLDRLPSQADLYSRVFDRMTLVVGARHAEKALALIPDWWGVTIAAGDGGTVRLSDHRQSLTNPSPDPYLVAQLLWRDEALGLLDSNGLSKGWRSKRAADLHQRLAAELSFGVLASSVRTILKRRSGWLSNVVGDPG